MKKQPLQASTYQSGPLKNHRTASLTKRIFTPFRDLKAPPGLWQGLVDGIINSYRIHVWYIYHYLPTFG